MSNNSVETFLQLALSQAELGQWKDAEKNFRQVLRLSTEQPDALLGLARLAQTRGKQRQAREQYRNLITRHPNFLPGILAYLKLEIAENALEHALPVLEQALERYPRHLQLHKLAVEIFEQRQPERAAFHLRQLLSWYPDDGESWLLYAQLSLSQGELKEALQGFEQAVKAQPELRNDPRWIDIEQPMVLSAQDQQWLETYFKG